MNLKGSNILITGGSSGIGKATADLLVKSGANVAITARNESRLSMAAVQTGSFPIHADVSLQEDVDRTFDIFMKKFARLDVLINNAGYGAGFGPVDQLNMQAFKEVYATNVFGAAMMAQRAAQIFKHQNYGNIINIASSAAVKGYENGTIYSSSKFALRGMTQCWQAELRKYNVRVVLINPSYVATAFGSFSGEEKAEESNKLTGNEIAHTIKSTLEMDNRGFIPEVSVWATNPF
ncbi:MAG: SDR family oxidoreductase [Bacteroidota bacterium]|nr:SDR family oxidoreductase [Bacteroidota bacterium]